MSHYTLIQSDVIDWMIENRDKVLSGEMDRFHFLFGDGPYYLASIVDRFGKEGSAPAKFGKDGSFSRLSKGFQSKTWDGFDSPQSFQAWVTKWATLALDFVYPGGLGMFYGSPRTIHRLTSGFEDAGWEVVEQLLFLHGTGFPKSYKAYEENIKKQLEAQGLSRPFLFSWEDWEPDANEATHSVVIDERTYPVICTVEPNANGDDETFVQAHEDLKWISDFSNAIKPAYEPILVVRAPKGHNVSYIDVALKYGTGMFNIGGTRIPTTDNTQRVAGVSALGQESGWNKTNTRPMDTGGHPGGRWPSNVILDTDAARELDQIAGNRASTGDNPSNADSEGFVLGGKRTQGVIYSDEGGPSRYHYTIKPSRWEREIGLGNVKDKERRNTHPTIKSIMLNEYISTMALPPEIIGERRALNFFAGSGSESIGLHFAGFETIVAIEREAEYVPINQARTDWWMRFASYSEAKAAAGIMEETVEPQRLRLPMLDLLDRINHEK